MRHTYNALLAFAACFSISTPAFSDVGWFSTAAHKCSSNPSVQAALDSGDYFTVFFERSINNPTQGLTHLIIPRRQLVTTDTPRIIEEIPLNASSAGTLRGITYSAGESIRVPFVSGQIVSALSGILSGGIGGIITGGVFSHFFEQINAAADTYQRLSFDIVDGGVLKKILQTGRERGTGATHVLVSNIYSINIGNTVREYIISSCIFPVEVNVQEFQTTAGNGDKVLTRDGTAWKQFDIESGRYDDKNLLFAGQDEEFYYLNEINNGQVFNRYRVSMFGGPFQKEFLGGNWLTLYQTTTAE